MSTFTTWINVYIYYMEHQYTGTIDLLSLTYSSFLDQLLKCFFLFPKSSEVFLEKQESKIIECLRQNKSVLSTLKSSVCAYTYNSKQRVNTNLLFHRTVIEKEVNSQRHSWITSFEDL